MRRSRRDQRVVAGKRPLLDLGLGRGAAQLAQRIGVLERGDRAITGKRTGVSAGELARVERHREQLALRDAELDAAADQARVERVVARVDAHVRVGRDPDHPAAVDVGHAIGQRPHDGQLLGPPVERPAAQPAVEARVGTLIEPAVELLPEVELGREAPTGLEARLRVALQPLDHTPRPRIPRLEEPPADAELTAERRQRLGRAAAAGVQRALAAQTSVSGSAPSRARQQPIPYSRSGASFENTSVPEPARE
jgi:hypothetical protein